MQVTIRYQPDSKKHLFRRLWPNSINFITFRLILALALWHNMVIATNIGRFFLKVFKALFVHKKECCK